MARSITVTLDDDVAAKLDEAARRRGASVQEVVIEAVRKLEAEAEPRKPFVVRPFNMGVPKIDLECTGRALEILDELEKLEKDDRR